ncbi:RPGR, partial [Symbiodinium microadriaticum]
MLLLTYNGSVYSCGDNTEGALGLGDSFNRTSLTLILWPIDAQDSGVVTSPSNPLREDGEAEGTSPSSAYKKIVYVAAGSSAIGSHSMALTEEGQLYGWGVPYATGHGVLEPSLSPRLVDVPSPEPEGILAVPPPVGEATAALEGVAEVPPPPPARVKHVACGGGFTVAVLTTGHVATFGMWAHGRLGLGPAPVSKINRGAGAIKSKAGRNKKKIVRYQLKPRIVRGISNAVK